MNTERDFFLQLAKDKEILIKPVSVVPGEQWEISHELSDIEIITIGLMPKVGKSISLRDAYAKRWLQNAYKNSEGNYFLKNSRAIRTPLIQWARNNGFYIEITNDVYLNDGNGNSSLS